MIPETRYAKTVDGVHIAYQVFGEGPPDMVVTGWATTIEWVWRWEWAREAVAGYGSFARVLMFDRRGTGASDHILGEASQLTLEARMDDVRAVMDAAGSEQAVLFGIEDGFSSAAMFAASYPERAIALVGWAAAARERWAPDYPWGTPDDEFEADVADVERLWGTRELAGKWAAVVFPDFARDEELLQGFAGWMRSAGGPRGYRRAVPRGRRDRHPGPPALDPGSHPDPPSDRGPSHPPRARPLPGGAHPRGIPGGASRPDPFLVGPGTEDLPGELERFVRQLSREEAELDRILATVLFTDIVGSTERAAALGDRAWGELVQAHHGIVRGLLARYRGTEVDTAGDGFFATFDGPARAVRCALGLVDAVRSLGLEIRAGVHTGEVETVDGKAAGLAVNIGARWAPWRRPERCWHRRR